uniref:nucleosome-remodeling factor subunit BPTF-like n=1 Tax=Styela clava TaxID=7725 RepID=UPI00193ABEDC|nr:nucleosome-remodeling factor subunit BPTF-like [Styela clava]
MEKTEKERKEQQEKAEKEEQEKAENSKDMEIGTEKPEETSTTTPEDQKPDITVTKTNTDQSDVPTSTIQTIPEIKEEIPKPLDKETIPVPASSTGEGSQPLTPNATGSQLSTPNATGSQPLTPVKPELQTAIESITEPQPTNPITVGSQPLTPKASESSPLAPELAGSQPLTPKIMTSQPVTSTLSALKSLTQSVSGSQSLTPSVSRSQPLTPVVLSSTPTRPAITLTPRGAINPVLTPKLIQGGQGKNIQVIKLNQKPVQSNISQLKTLFVLNKDGSKTQITLGPAGKLMPANATGNAPTQLNRQILVLNSAKVALPKVNRELKKLEFTGAGPKTLNTTPTTHHIISTPHQLRRGKPMPATPTTPSQTPVTIKEEPKPKKILTHDEEAESYFRLGEDKAYRQYVNHYTENNLALNKLQHKEERDRERYLSYKFSLFGEGQFKWIGDTMGNEKSMLETLRSTLMHLEHQIPLCFMHTKWERYRKAWGKIVLGCDTPQNFAAALGILEMATRNVVKRSVWRVSNGLPKMKRVSVTDKEEWDKKRKHKLRADEEESNRNAVWCKYTFPIKSSLVWKVRGEEYRMTGYGGWIWVSTTRLSKTRPYTPKPFTLVHEMSKDATPTTNEKPVKMEVDTPEKKETVPVLPDIDTDSEKSTSTTSTTTTKSADLTEEKTIFDSLVQEASSQSKPIVTSSETTVTSQSESDTVTTTAIPTVTSQSKSPSELYDSIINSCDVINVSENLLKRTPIYNKKWSASKVDILLGWRMVQKEKEAEKAEVKAVTNSDSTTSEPKPVAVVTKSITTTTNVKAPTDVTMATSVAVSNKPNDIVKDSVAMETNKTSQTTTNSVTMATNENKHLVEENKEDSEIDVVGGMQGVNSGKILEGTSTMPLLDKIPCIKEELQSDIEAMPQQVNEPMEIDPPVSADATSTVKTNSVPTAVNGATTSTKFEIPQISESDLNTGDGDTKLDPNIPNSIPAVTDFVDATTDSVDTTTNSVNATPDPVDVTANPNHAKGNPICATTETENHVETETITSTDDSLTKPDAITNSFDATTNGISADTITTEDTTESVDSIVETTQTNMVSEDQKVTVIETITTTVTKTTTLSKTIISTSTQEPISSTSVIGSTGALLTKPELKDDKDSGIGVMPQKANVVTNNDANPSVEDGTNSIEVAKNSETEVTPQFVQDATKSESRAIEVMSQSIQDATGSGAIGVMSKSVQDAAKSEISAYETLPSQQVQDTMKSESIASDSTPQSVQDATKSESTPQSSRSASPNVKEPIISLPRITTKSGIKAALMVTNVHKSKVLMSRMSRQRRVRRQNNNGVLSSTQTVWKLQRYRKTSSTLKKESAMKLPLPWKFTSGKLRKKSIFRLPASVTRKLAISGGQWAYRRGFTFGAKWFSGLEQYWFYPCPRPTFSLTWRYKLQNVNTFGAVAHLIRIFWHAIKWDRMTMRPQNDDVVNSVTTDDEIITTELLKRKDNLSTGLHSEYYVRRITMPITDPEEEALKAIKPAEGYTPSRKGLRSSRRSFTARENKKETGPQVQMLWVPEEEVELWQIRQFDILLKQQQNRTRPSATTTPSATFLQSEVNTFITTPSGGILPTLQNLKPSRSDLSTSGPGFNIVKLPLHQNAQILQKSLNSGKTLIGKSPVSKIVVHPGTAQFTPYKQIGGSNVSSQQTIVRSTPSGTHYIVQGGKLVKPIMIKASSPAIVSPIQPRSQHPSIRLSDGSHAIKFNQQSPMLPSPATIAPRPPAPSQQTQIKLTTSQLSQLMKVGAATPVRVSVTLGNGRTGIGQIQLIPPGSQVTPSSGQQLMQTRVGGEVKKFLFTLISETIPPPTPVSPPVNEVSLKSASLSQRLQQIQKHQFMPGRNKNTEMKRLMTDKDPLWGSKPQSAERTPTISSHHQHRHDNVERPRPKPLSRIRKEEGMRQTVVMQVMKSILDRIERKEELENRKRKREEALLKQKERKEQTEQMKVHNRQTQILHKHRDHLKQDILKRRAVVEKYLTHAAKNELREDLRKHRRNVTESTGAPVSKRPKKTSGNAIVTSAVLTENNSKRPIKEGKGNQQPIIKKRRETMSPPPEPKKTKMINTQSKKKDTKLYCICKTQYDPTKFYIGCDLCLNWFHGTCVGIPETRAKSMNEWICEECQKAKEEPAQELYCICRTPYDDSMFYIGCDICQDWYHGDCVGISEKDADKIEFYTCPRCKNKKKGASSAVAENLLTPSDHIALTKIIRSLRAHKMAWPFLQPVSKYEVPNYYKVIKKPMDLGTVMNKLPSYTLLSELMGDISLIFDNCRMFNGADSALAKCAEIVESVFVGKIREYRSRRKSK